MTFTTTAPASALAKAFAIAARVSPRAGSAPILQNLLLAEHEGRLRITGASPDATITVDVDVPAKGAITAPADKLGAIASRMEGAKPLKLKLEGASLVATQGRSRFTMPTIAADGFTGTFAAETLHAFEVSGKALSDALKMTEGATDTEGGSRANLSGAYLDPCDGAPLLVALDGKTLSASPLATTCPEDMPGALIPPGTFAVIHAMAALAETVQIEVGASSIAITAGGVRYQSKLLEGIFPPWRRIVDRDSERATSVTVAGDAMRKLMERIGAIGESVLLISFDKAISIEARGKDKAASGADDMAECADMRGPAVKTRLNSADLSWALASLPGAASYVFGLRGEADSVSVSDPARPEDIRLVMPLRG